MIDRELDVQRALKGKRRGGVIEQWHIRIVTNEDDKCEIKIGTGYIYGDARWSDGVPMYTSPIVNIHKAERILETLNTYYELGEPSTPEDGELLKT